MILIDTSVLFELVRYPGKVADLESLVEPVLAAQCIHEYWVVATRSVTVNGLGLRPAEALEQVEAIRSLYPVLTTKPNELDRWLEIVHRYKVVGKPAHDARLVAVMMGHGIKTLLTSNPSDFARYREIQTIPF